MSSERGREADHPGEIPPKGWMDVLWRAWGEVSEQNLFLIAGGVTYAILLALFPGLAALGFPLRAGASMHPRSRSRWARSPAFCRRRRSNC